MSEERSVSKIVDSIVAMVTPENIQKYVLGTTKTGQPRALYDIVRDFGGKKHKKHKNRNGNSSYDIFVKAKKGKKKKKRNKHWHI